MKKALVIIFLVGVAGFLLWKFVFSLEDSSPANSAPPTPAIDKDETIYDDAILDLEEARETLDQ